MRASAKADRDEARAELNNFDRLLRQQEAAAQRLKRDAVEFANLQGEANKKRETLNALMGRQTEMSLSSRLKDMDTTSTNIRIVETARPPAAPYRPRIKLNLMLGLVVGLGLGVVTAFVLDYLDNTINSPGRAGATSSSFRCWPSCPGTEYGQSSPVKARAQGPARRNACRST